MQNVKADTINEYIASFPKDIQKKLREIRSVIKASAPDAGEKISYAIPTFTVNGNLVHFAAFKNHIGFYPDPKGIEAVKKELSKYEGGKGTVQFPLDKPLPIALIKKIVKFRAKQNRESVKQKKK